jgi:alkylation response protein AidB-like acyl-CoA dehydrogenase
MENALATAQMAWREMVQSAADYAFEPELGRANSTLIRKSIAARAIEKTVQKAFESTGGSAFFRKNPLEKLFRDAQGVHFHPLPEKKQLLFSGRIAMGLDPA